MAFYYNVASQAGTSYTSHATPSTEDPTIVLRQATRNFDLVAMFCQGRAAAATTISGISYVVRRWTTAGSGGTAVNLAPTRIGTTAATTAVDKASAITAGTVSGVIVATMSCGKAGPGAGSPGIRMTLLLLKRVLRMNWISTPSAGKPHNPTT